MNATKPPRFPQLTMEQLNAEQRPLAEEIMKFSRVGIGGPYNILLRSPVLLRRMLDLWNYLRWNTSLPLHLNEFAILIVGRRWRSQIEWYAHVPIALKAGLSQSIIDQLKQKKRPEGMKDDEAIVYDFCTELAANHAVSDETFARAKRSWASSRWSIWWRSAAPMSPPRCCFRWPRRCRRTAPSRRSSRASRKPRTGRSAQCFASAVAQKCGFRFSMS